MLHRKMSTKVNCDRGACAQQQGDGGKQTEQVEESADVAHEDALVGFGILLSRAVDKALLLSLLHLSEGEALVEGGVEAYRFRGRGLLFPFIFLPLFGEKGTEPLFSLFFFGRIFGFRMLVFFHECSPGTPFFPGVRFHYTTCADKLQVFRRKLREFDFI